MSQFDELLAKNPRMRYEVEILHRVFPASHIRHAAPYYNECYLVDNYPVYVDVASNMMLNLDNDKFFHGVTVSGLCIYWHKKEFYRKDNLTPLPDEPRPVV